MPSNPTQHPYSSPKKPRNGSQSLASWDTSETAPEAAITDDKEIAVHPPTIAIPVYLSRLSFTFFSCLDIRCNMFGRFLYKSFGPEARLSDIETLAARLRGSLLGRRHIQRLRYKQVELDRGS